MIVYQKIPLLHQIKLEEVDKERRKKYSLLEQRLKRKLKNMAERVKFARIADLVTHTKSRLNDLKKAVKQRKSHYIRALKTTRDSHDKAPDALAETNKLIDAENLFKQGKTKEAEELVYSLIKENPKALEGYKLLAKIYFENKNFIHAEATLEHVVQLAKRLKAASASLFLELAEIKTRLEKFGEALQHARKAVSLEPLNPKVLHFMVRICILCKQKELAWKYFRKLKQVSGANNGLDDMLDDLKKLE